MLGRHISPQLQVGHTTSASRSVRSWSQIAALGGDTKANEARPRGSDFFHREKEEEFLNRTFDSEPGVIAVLVGPPDCGKTKLLDKVASSRREKKGAPPFLYIDCRLTRITSPEDISKELCSQIAFKNVGWLKSLSTPLQTKFVDEFKTKGGTKLPSLPWSNGAQIDPVDEFSLIFFTDDRNLTTTITKFVALFKALEGLPMTMNPVIVIDEANELRNWKEPGPSAKSLKQLVNFFVAISKQNRSAHVMLATTDFFLVEWLCSKGLTYKQAHIMAIGDLEKEEAKAFMLGNSATVPASDPKHWPGCINMSANTIPRIADDEWEEIYSRCGGNIGLLQECVIEAGITGSWEDALDIVIAGCRSAVMDGFRTEVMAIRDVPCLWTKAQWQAVLRRIVDAEHHAVLRSELEAELDRNKGGAAAANGGAILRSMVKYNLLEVRPASHLARDLPVEVHGTRREEVVTLPSPGHVWAAKQLKRRWGS